MLFRSLTGVLPDWTPPPARQYEGSAVPSVRARYAEVRDLTEGCRV